MNLGALKNAVARRLGRDDANDAPLGDYINSGVDRISRLVKFPVLERTATPTVTSGGFVIMPPDTGFIRLVYTNDGRELETTSQPLFLQYQKRQGDPAYFLQVGARLYLAPVPPEGYQIGLTYWGFDRVMVLDSDENDLARVCPDALIYAALREAAVDFDDDRASLFEAEFQTRKGEVEQQAADFYASLQPQAQRSYLGDCFDFSSYY